MVDDEPPAALRRELLGRLVDSWIPDALRRSRRATIVQAYGTDDAGAAPAGLQALTPHTGLLRRGQLAVIVLSAASDDLAVRLGAVEAELPAGLTVHLLPGGLDRLPTALRAAGAAGAPVLAYLDASGAVAPDPATLTAIAKGRPAEVLIVAELTAHSAAEHRDLLADAGFPLTTVLEVTAPEPRTIIFGTGSDRRLAAVKDTLWSAGAVCGARLRDPDSADGRVLEPAGGPDHARLRRRLLDRLIEVGPCSVTELRRFTAERTPYRAAETGPALARLLAAGEVSRQPADGRLGGHVIICATVPTGR